MINLNDFLAVGQNAIARRVVQHSDASDNYSNAFKVLFSQRQKVVLTLAIRGCMSC